MHPVYLSTDINAPYINREHRGGLEVIGFLPEFKHELLDFSPHQGPKHLIIDELGDISSDHKREIRHRCMEYVTSSSGLIFNDVKHNQVNNDTT